MGNKITTTVKNIANKLNPWAKPPVNEEEEEFSPYGNYIIESHVIL